MSAIKSYTISVNGDQYTIVSDENFAMVEALAQRVDATISDIAKKTESRDVRRCAVLAALQFAHHLHKLESDVQKKSYEDALLIEKINQQISSLIS